MYAVQPESPDDLRQGLKNEWRQLNADVLSNVGVAFQNR